jgi:hypothetical protein
VRLRPTWATEWALYQKQQKQEFKAKTKDHIKTTIFPLCFKYQKLMTFLFCLFEGLGTELWAWCLCCTTWGLPLVKTFRGNRMYFLGNTTLLSHHYYRLTKMAGSWFSIRELTLDWEESIMSPASIAVSVVVITLLLYLQTNWYFEARVQVSGRALPYNTWSPGFNL